MSIGVQSYPELYIMLSGWDLYDKLWELLTQTGIAYLPFIGMILKNIWLSWTEGHKGSETALRSMEMNFITTLLVILFAVAPCIPLDVHTVSYTPFCGTDKGTTYHPGETGTTYDKAFAIPDGNIRVPIWWYAVISIAEGLTTSADTMVGCVPNLRKMVTEVNMTKITDPELLSQIQDFQTMCFAPAKLQFNADNRDNNTSNLDRVKENVSKYGVDDTEWMGSHAFNDTYYKNLRATRPIPGFRYESLQDINSDISEISPPVYGMPTCSLWWNESTDGIKIRLHNALSKTFLEEFQGYIGTEKAKDDVIKRIISGISDGYTGYNNANDTIGNVGFSHATSALGIWFHQLEEYPKIYAAAQAAPIVQALLLLLTYVFLPFALVFTSYRASTLITGSILIFSLIFWQFIWHLVSWTDKSLMQALYANWFTQQGAGATLTDMIIGSLVIGAPLFWFMFMGAMGIAIGNAVSAAATGMTKIGDKAAATGASQVKSMADTAMKL